MEELGEWWNDGGAIVQCGPTARPRPRQRNGQSGIKESGRKQRKSYQKKKKRTVLVTFHKRKKYKFHQSRIFLSDKSKTKRQRKREN